MFIPENNLEALNPELHFLCFNLLARLSMNLLCEIRIFKTQRTFLFYEFHGCTVHQ